MSELTKEHFDKQLSQMRREMVTKVDLDKRLANFATKEDIKQLKQDMAKFATKDDIKQIKQEMAKFVTKDDLKQFATKDDLKQFATKEDLDDLRLEMAKTSETKAIRVDILGVKDEIKEVRRDLDAYAKDILRHNRQNAMLIHDVKRLKSAIGIR